jgi:hypothetical protein
MVTLFYIFVVVVVNVFVLGHFVGLGYLGIVGQGYCA